MRAASLIAALGAAVVLGACEEHEYQPPDRDQHVATADSAYSTALFDTLTWSSPSERIRAGNLVFADECRRCHGPVGRGDTEYAQAQDIAVPSLIRADWEAGDDLDAVRRRIFTGHAAGMPTWGLVRLSPRQVDAAAFYIVEQLRPEMADSTPGT